MNRKDIFFILIFLAMSITAAAQEKATCPTITVDGPIGIVHPGDPAIFTATVAPNNPDLKLEWTVSVGEIKSGQGTSIIYVVQPLGYSLTVTLHVKNMPQGCPDSASETSPIEILLAPILLNEFSGNLSKISRLQMVPIVQRAKSSPFDAIYFVVSGEAKDSPKKLSSKIAQLKSRFIKGGLSSNRMVFIRSDKNDNRVLVYDVPAGAGMPTP